MYAYLNSGSRVVGLSRVERTLPEAQAVNPDIASIISNAPDGLVSTFHRKNKGLPAYCHKHTSGDGSQIGHYTQQERLIDLKKYGRTLIEEKTDELIALGFEYPPSSGTMFSLSMKQQIRIAGIDAARDLPQTIYPITWNNIDRSEKIQLADSTDVHNFYLVGLATLRARTDYGSGKLQDLRDASTKAEVDAVLDSL
jgi:hypothetical protein